MIARRKLVVAQFFLVGSLSAGLAAQISVPEDYPTIQAAIDAAQPNQVITVHGGVYEETITIDKPLTLQGDPVATITFQDQPWHFDDAAPSQISIYGFDSGEVNLAHLVVNGWGADDHWNWCGPAIWAEGFSKLSIIDCDIRGTDIVGSESGGSQGGSGIHAIDIPVLVIVGSHVAGGDSDGVCCPAGGNGASTGVYAQWTLIVIDSDITGGKVKKTYVEFPIPFDCEAIAYAEGGTGICANLLYVDDGSFALGGQGGVFIDSISDPSITCTKPDGLPIYAKTTWKDFGGALTGTAGQPVLAGSGFMMAQSVVTLSLTAAKPFSLSTLVSGVSKLDAPFKGGVLVPEPTLLFPLLTDGFGSLAFGGSWPTGVPSGFETYFQWWIQDPAGPKGFAASNALAGTTP